MASHLNVGLSSLSINGELKFGSRRIKLRSDEDTYHELEEKIAELSDRVDSLLTFTNHYEFPTTGQSGVFYVATDENILYIWEDSAYVPLTGVDSLDVELVNGGGAADGE